MKQHTYQDSLYRGSQQQYIRKDERDERGDSMAAGGVTFLLIERHSRKGI
jgi:hypothetical protein